MEISSSRAFARTSVSDRLRKPATLSTGMPCRSVLPRKNKSALFHSKSGPLLPNLEHSIFNPNSSPPAKTPTVQGEYVVILISHGEERALVTTSVSLCCFDKPMIPSARMLTCCTGIRSRSNNAVPPPTPPHHAVSAGGGVALCPQRDDFRLRADQGAFGGVGILSSVTMTLE